MGGGGAGGAAGKSTTSSDGVKGSGTGAGAGGSGRRTQFRGACYHCQGEHLLRNCPTATAEQKTTILSNLQSQGRSMRSNRGNAQAKAVRESRDESKLPDTEKAGPKGEASGEGKDHLSLLTVGSVRVPYELDDGANHTYVSRKLVEPLLSSGVPLVVRELDQPEVVSLASDESTMTCTAILSKVAYSISTRCGEVQIPAEDLWIVEEPMPSVLVGHDALVSIGIDVSSMAV